jgi:hypothetical protein
VTLCTQVVNALIMFPAFLPFFVMASMQLWKRGLGAIQRNQCTCVDGLKARRWYYTALVPQKAVTVTAQQSDQIGKKCILWAVFLIYRSMYVGQFFVPFFIGNSYVLICTSWAKFWAIFSQTHQVALLSRNLRHKNVRPSTKCRCKILQFTKWGGTYGRRQQRK